jgi:hypothetical protein
MGEELMDSGRETETLRQHRLENSQTALTCGLAILKNLGSRMTISYARQYGGLSGEGIERTIPVKACSGEPNRAGPPLSVNEPPMIPTKMSASVVHPEYIRSEQ